MSELEHRKIEAQIGRSRLMVRINQVRDRVQLTSLLDDVKGATRKKAIHVVTATVSQRKAYPLIAMGAISAGLAYLFRRPLLNALAKRLQTEKDDDR